MLRHFMSRTCVNPQRPLTLSRAGLRAPGAGRGTEGNGKEGISAVVPQFCGSSVVKEFIIAARHNARGAS